MIFQKKANFFKEKTQIFPVFCGPLKLKFLSGPLGVLRASNSAAKGRSGPTRKTPGES
jgi:hypothetical protein